MLAPSYALLSIRVAFLSTPMQVPAASAGKEQLQQQPEPEEVVLYMGIIDILQVGGGRCWLVGKSRKGWLVGGWLVNIPSHQQRPIHAM